MKDNDEPTDDAPRGKGGRPSRGNRVKLAVRVSEEMHDEIKAKCDDLGIEMNTLVVAAIADALPRLRRPRIIAPADHELEI